MSDSQDKSDDLIAELAKLMASGAAGSESAPKPTVIKLPPLDDATIKAAPVRIPGMDAPSSSAEKPARPAPSSSGGAVRIPGMDRPAEVSDSMPSAPKPRPGSQFDFGKPAAAVGSSAAPAAAVSTSSASAAPAPASHAPASPAAASPTPPRPVARPAGAGVNIPPVTFSAPPPAKPAPPPPVHRAESDDDSDETPARAAPVGHQQEPSRQPVPQRQPTPQPAPQRDVEAVDTDEDDPIADLIAAELGGHQDEPDANEDLPRPVVSPAPVQPRPQPVQPPPTVRPSAANVTPRQPDADRFNVAPQFGGGERQAPPASHAASAPVPPVDSYDDDESDPMDEIESLIGEAVRVELNPPERSVAPAPAPTPTPTPAAGAPVVPPLNTSFGPRRSGLRETEPQVDSAEAAIMAAAADSDIDFDEIDAPAEEDRPYKRMRVKPPRTSMIPGGVRQYVGIAVAGTLLLAAGFGLYWVLGMDRGDPAEAPVLTADASPTKVEPVTPVTTSEPASGSVVFDEIDGVSDSGDEEALVSRDETAGETPAEVARVVTPTTDDGETAVADTGLANRKVRTVTVRPDGTIVASDDTVAGTSALPVDRPNVPEIAGAAEQSDLLTAAVAETRVSTDVDPLSALTAESGSGDLLTADPIDVAALNQTTETPAVFDGSLAAPVPMPRPFAREAMVGGSQPVSLTTSTPAPASGTSGANAPASTPLTALTTTQQSSTPAPAASSGSRTYVQLSSQRTEADANASMRAVQSRLGGLLNSSLEIRRVDLGAKGIWYRVVMPTSSFQDATQSCARIKANGGDCVAING